MKQLFIWSMIVIQFILIKPAEAQKASKSLLWSDRWSMGLAGSIIPMHIEAATDKEQTFIAGCILVNYDLSELRAIRGSFSASNKTSEFLKADGYIYGDGGGYTTFNIEEQWWIAEIRFEMVMQLKRLTSKRFGCYLTTGLSFRDVSSMEKLEPYPTEDYIVYSTYISEEEKYEEHLYDTYLGLLAGLGVKYNMGSWSALMETGMEATCVPDLLGGGESLSARVRLSLGLSYHFGIKK